MLFTLLVIPPGKPACRSCVPGRLILYFDRIQVDSDLADEVQIAPRGKNAIGGPSLALVGDDETPILPPQYLYDL